MIIRTNGSLVPERIVYTLRNEGYDASSNRQLSRKHRLHSDKQEGDLGFHCTRSSQIKKSDDPLTITCEDGPGKISVQVVPERGAMGWGNIVFGGIIGGGVDASSDAHWDISDSLVLSRKFCNGKQLN